MEQNSFQLDYIIFEFSKSLKEMKNGEAPGADEIMTEQIAQKHNNGCKMYLTLVALRPWYLKHGRKQR